MDEYRDLKISIQGRYFAPHASHFFAATLTRDSEGLILHREHFLEPLRLGNYDRSQPLAGVPTKLTFPDGSVFEALSEDGLLEVLDIHPGIFERIKHHEGRYKSVTVALVLTIATLSGYWIWGLPSGASIAAWLTPPALSRAMDIGTLATLDRSFIAPTTLSLDEQSIISSDFKQLAAASDTPPGQLVLLFRNAPGLGPNAFALPGGSIILTDQLVRIARDPDEIAGVLAHEIGHVHHRHALRLIYQALGMSFLISMVSGDPGSAIDTVIQQASAIQNLSYSRAFETAADRSSVELMQRLHRDPRAFLRLIGRIPAAIGNSERSYLSTHPGFMERERAVDALLSGKN